MATNPTTPNSYKRPGFPARPWITGALYDLLARDSILHLDARCVITERYDALVLDWTEGGRVFVARDVYLIEPDGLTELWAAPVGTPLYWTRANAALLARVHRTVLELAARVEAHGIAGKRWARVSVLCHYVNTRERDGEIPRERNHYAEYGSKRGQPQPGKAATGRARGRPRKAGALPDWL